MKTTCESCTSIFSITYDKTEIEESVAFCPFCGEKLFLDEEFLFTTSDDDDITLDEYDESVDL